MKRLLRNIKLVRLLRILTNRKAITLEEGVAIAIVNALSKFSQEEREKKLFDSFDSINSKNLYIKRAMTKIIYQTGFLEKIEHDYYNNILPYLKSHSLFSLLRNN